MQIDFTEGRLAVKLDPSGQLLSSFIALTNRVLGQFREEERKRIGVHTCPGGDGDSTHSADVDYSGLLPSLFSLDIGEFYILDYCARQKIAGTHLNTFDTCILSPASHSTASKIFRSFRMATPKHSPSRNSDMQKSDGTYLHCMGS